MGGGGFEGYNQTPDTLIFKRVSHTVLIMKSLSSQRIGSGYKQDKNHTLWQHCNVAFTMLIVQYLQEFPDLSTAQQFIAEVSSSTDVFLNRPKDTSLSDLHICE